MIDSDKGGSRKTLSEQRQQRLDRLRTINKSLAQDLLNAYNDGKYNYVENYYLSWKNSFTDVMKFNVHPTNYHTHT